MVKDQKHKADKIHARNQAPALIRSSSGQANLLTETDGISSQRPNPLYQQVKDYILTRIKSGTWQPETRVPSENEIVDSLGVSRMTVNRALRELTTEGHLVRQQGVGTFVARRKPQGALLEIRSIADEIAEWGGVHTCEVRLLTEETAGKELAQSMGLEPGAPVFRSVLVHRDRGRPIQYSDRYVNPQAAPDYLKQDFTKVTPSEYLLQVAPLQELEHVVEAVLPDQTAQTLLEIGPDEPCLIVYRRTWSFNIVATSSWLTYPGSRYRLGGRSRASSLIRPDVM